MELLYNRLRKNKSNNLSPLFAGCTVYTPIPSICPPQCQTSCSEVCPSTCCVATPLQQLTVYSSPVSPLPMSTWCPYPCSSSYMKRKDIRGKENTVTYAEDGIVYWVSNDHFQTRQADILRKSSRVRHTWATHSRSTTKNKDLRARTNEFWLIKDWITLLKSVILIANSITHIVSKELKRNNWAGFENNTTTKFYTNGLLLENSCQSNVNESWSFHNTESKSSKTSMRA